MAAAPADPVSGNRHGVYLKPYDPPRARTGRTPQRQPLKRYRTGSPCRARHLPGREKRFALAMQTGASSNPTLPQRPGSSVAACRRASIAASTQQAVPRARNRQVPKRRRPTRRQRAISQAQVCLACLRGQSVVWCAQLLASKIEDSRRVRQRCLPPSPGTTLRLWEFAASSPSRHEYVPEAASRRRRALAPVTSLVQACAALRCAPAAACVRHGRQP